jgi:hypothetical protein
VISGRPADELRHVRRLARGQQHRVTSTRIAQNHSPFAHGSYCLSALCADRMRSAETWRISGNRADVDDRSVFGPYDPGTRVMEQPADPHLPHDLSASGCSSVDVRPARHVSWALLHLGELIVKLGPSDLIQERSPEPSLDKAPFHECTQGLRVVATIARTNIHRPGPFVLLECRKSLE